MNHEDIEIYNYKEKNWDNKNNNLLVYKQISNRHRNKVQTVAKCKIKLKQQEEKSINPQITQDKIVKN